MVRKLLKDIGFNYNMHNGREHFDYSEIGENLVLAYFQTQWAPC